jgi:small subunit ribosomal protein S3
LRLSLNKDWSSKWYAEKDFSTLLHNDLKIRSFIKKKLFSAGVADINIERLTKKARITIKAARPGLIIGKKGSDIEALKKELVKISGVDVTLNIDEVRKPEIDATLIGQNIAQQLERRVSFRKAMKRAMQSAMRSGALGIRVNCAGRLGGAEIARTEWYREGRVPLHTLRANIDYAEQTALTTYGILGIKVWVYKGDASSSHSNQSNGSKSSKSKVGFEK